MFFFEINCKYLDKEGEFGVQQFNDEMARKNFRKEMSKTKR